MLLEQTITKLNKMKMFGMAKEIARQTESVNENDTAPSFN